MLKVGRNIRDIWIYFKTGHNGYLTFLLSLMNFVVLQHRLLISYIPFLSKFLGQLSTFFVFFLVTYIPVAVGIGYFEFQKGEMKRRPQLSPWLQDDITARMLQTQAFQNYIDGNPDEARILFEESFDVLRKWRNPQR